MVGLTMTKHVASEVNPIFVGEPKMVMVDSLSAVCTPEVLSLDGAMQVRVVAEDGREITIPHDILKMLNSWGVDALNSVEGSLRLLRQTFFDFDAVGFQSSRALGAESRFNPNFYMLLEGNPYLTWVEGSDSSNESDGWRLNLRGMDESPIGFARWDDRAGIQQLVTSMQDPGSLLALASLVDADTASKLSGRLAVQRLKEQKTLPKFSLSDAKEIIVAAHGTSAPHRITRRAKKGLSRIVYIKSGGNVVPVAVALKAPDILANNSSPEDKSRRGISGPYQDYMKVLIEEGTAPWFEKITAAFTTAGWFLVDLPQPRLDWESKAKVIYFTKIDPSTWGGVRAAVAEVAKTLEMNRGKEF